MPPPGRKAREEKMGRTPSLPRGTLVLTRSALAWLGRLTMRGSAFGMDWLTRTGVSSLPL
ncbi:hypothetical protein [Anaerolinea sp.]|uniref:hypothetical protein n=1 Tax=Anaerolinea sp. TaxID=1872519 RepID=UPI002ACD2DC6|nr:hypothetical protein [Anaerolinea sp.]